MCDKRHCKILYERDVDMDEFDVFYDYEKPNKKYAGLNEGLCGSAVTSEEKEATTQEQPVVTENEEEGDEDDEGEWEDVPDDGMDDGDDDDEDDDEDMYEAYKSNINSQGFDITPLGELVFPDGRIIGHRGLSRYYKQRFAPDRTERDAVRAAREAAGERIYCGQVVNCRPMLANGIGSEEGRNPDTEGGMSSALALSRRNRVPLAGRSGKGILVANGGGTGIRGGFTSLSLYRYRAAVKKGRREERQGFLLQQRWKMNTNRMDKKANRLFNGVSVAHAKR